MWLTASQKQAFSARVRNGPQWGKFMYRLKSTALVAAASLALGGCATIVNGTSQDVKFQSDPGGALVRLTGGQSCTTPCEVSLKRRSDLRADFAKPGFKPAGVLIQSRMGGAVVGNLLLGGIIGGAVDSANGASKHLSPNPVHVKLAAEGSAQEAMLIDQKGKESLLATHNDKVRLDVAKTIGAEAAAAGSSATVAAAPASVEPAAMAPAATATALPAPTTN